VVFFLGTRVESSDLGTGDDVVVLGVVFEAGVLLPPCRPIHANDIWLVYVPLPFGALKSQVMSTYGQQSLSPIFTMSPATYASFATTGEPINAPVLSTSCMYVPENVPVQDNGTG
jgi:hypothetical protein